MSIICCQPNFGKGGYDGKKPNNGLAVATIKNTAAYEMDFSSEKFFKGLAVETKQEQLKVVALGYL